VRAAVTKAGFMLFGMIVGVLLGLAVGVNLGEAERAGDNPLPGGSRPPLRCAQSVQFDARNTPVLTERTWTRAEAEGRYQAAKAYLETAEAEGLWNDRGARAARLAVAVLLEILVCRGVE